MLYTYKFKDREYVVQILEEEGDVARIEFMKKINGGRGRLPRKRAVPKSNLNLLVNMEVARKLANK